MLNLKEAKKICIIVLCLRELFFPCTGLAASMDTEVGDTLITQGQKAFEQGLFEQAIRHWETAGRTAAKNPDIQLRLSGAYQAQGHFRKAIEILKKLLANNSQKKPNALIHSNLSSLYLAVQKILPAREHIDKSLAIARESASPLILANVLHNSGNVLKTQGHYPKALAAYRECADLAARAGSSLLRSKALSNSVHIHLENGDFQKAAAALQMALEPALAVADSYDKGLVLLAIGLLGQRPRLSAQSSIAYQALNTALRVAEAIRNDTLASYAAGYLGALYAQRQQYAEALRLTRRALFLGQGDLIYRWQRQLGSLFNAQKRRVEAIAAYRNAVQTLKPLRRSKAFKQPHESFDGPIAAVYLELADLLLRQAAETADGQARQAWLKEAIETLEDFKAVELQNYFRDRCVTEAMARIKPLKAEGRTAVLYPILLPKRLELLLNVPGKIEQVKAAISEEDFRHTVELFQMELQDRRKQTFLIYARKLYEWLIRPLEAHLSANGIDTLVIAPDAILRTIPLAALHDGKAFLIEKYALAATPGLQLTESETLPRRDARVMLSGLSEGVQGFAPLPAVPEELSRIRSLYGGRVLLDRRFEISSFETELKRIPYSIVHIASHGEFSSDPKKSFLLTYDGKLTMDQLEELIKLGQFRAKPVELLTLSACQTALGDQRAALGLAGVAVKAGARSVLASLWNVNDEATAQLVVEFYRQLLNPLLSKAKALQNAQLSLLKQKKYAHPNYWAAFLLIGNWL